MLLLQVYSICAYGEPAEIWLTCRHLRVFFRRVLLYSSCYVNPPPHHHHHIYLKVLGFRKIFFLIISIFCKDFTKNIFEVISAIINPKIGKIFTKRLKKLFEFSNLKQPIPFTFYWNQISSYFVAFFTINICLVFLPK